MMTGFPFSAKSDSPIFSLVKGNYGHYWISYGTEKIAIFGPGIEGDNQYSLGLFRQRPGQEIPKAWLTEPEILHFVTRRGLGLTTHWMNAAMASVTPALKVDESDSSCLRITLTSNKSKEEHGTITITFRLESQPQRYVVDVEYDLTLKEKGGGEFCNFYPHGTGDFRPDHGRFNRIVWQDKQGNSWLHWLNAIVPQPFPIELSPKGAFAYVDDLQGNPIVTFESCQPSMKTEMCLCWFDNHMIWTEPPERTSPPYHYHAKLKGYWLTGDESKKLMAEAREVSLEPYASKWDGYLPVRMGTTNDFESRVALDIPSVRCSYFPVGLKSPSPVVWDDKTGHSGTHSILFQLDKPDQIDSYFWGPELLVTPGKQVYISAWVKTENVEGEGFWLQTAFGRWDGGKGKGTLEGPFLSEKITGTHDWKQISIPMPVTPPDTEWLENRIRFYFKGKGKVWLDDLEFRER